jgi:hypothetical protein
VRNRFEKVHDEWQSRKPDILRWALPIIFLIWLLGQFVDEVETQAIDRGIIPLLTLVIVIELSVSLSQRTRVFPNQDEALPALLAIAQSGIRSADLLEYAGRSMAPLLRTLKTRNVKTRLLIHLPVLETPDKLSQYVRRLQTLVGDCGDSTYFEIRLYAVQASLRGRSLGTEILEVGWFTQDPDTKTCRGHSNPSTLLRRSDDQAPALFQFFNDSFEALWNHRSTISAEAFLEQHASGTP